MWWRNTVIGHARVDREDSSEKQIGAWTQQNLLDGLNAIRMAVLTRGLGWPTARVEMFLVDVKRDAGDRRIHAYIDV